MPSGLHTMKIWTYSVCCDLWIVGQTSTGNLHSYSSCHRTCVLAGLCSGSASGFLEVNLTPCIVAWVRYWPMWICLVKTNDLLHSITYLGFPLLHIHAYNISCHSFAYKLDKYSSYLTRCVSLTYNHMTATRYLGLLKPLLTVRSRCILSNSNLFVIHLGMWYA